MKSKNAKYVSSVSLIMFLLLFFAANRIFCQKKYTVQYILPGKDSSHNLQQLDLKNIFDTKLLAQAYLQALPQTLLGKGVPTASVDSVFYDSTFARVILYLGEQYKWVQINTDSIDEQALSSTGWNEKQFNNKKANFLLLGLQQQKLLTYYENSGYPFAEVSLKNIKIEDDKISGDLLVKKGPVYRIDSIRIIGRAKIKNLFLQHYLGIANGSLYNGQKLKQVSKLVQELPFLQESQPWNLSMLGTGATLNLYLEPKRSSEINLLVGFLPGNSVTTKSQLTADVHLDLDNALGSGENILLKWQQLQPQSPRLNLGYTHPYIFNSKFGISFSFDLLKRDSSYLQLNSKIGLQYLLSSGQQFTVFYQKENNYLLQGGVDTNQIISLKRLPPNIDVSSGNVGLGYHFSNTNYRLNPRKGNDVEISVSAGLKKTSKNNDIVKLQDPANPAFNFNSLYDSVKLKSYRIRLVASAAHYFPIGKTNTLKTALNMGLLESPNTFRNELFQIGGYKILRGFNEESIYANRYAVLTAEYRYLVGINSYIFGFSDAGWIKANYNNISYSNSFLSGGAGLAFETKFGLLNLSYAVGKRNDVKFDIRNSSKIHFGYINYF